MSFFSTSLPGQAPYPGKRCSDGALRVRADTSGAIYSDETQQTVHLSLRTEGGIQREKH